MITRKQRIAQSGEIAPNAWLSSRLLPRRAASGLVPLSAMNKEVERLSSYCLEHGNCYGLLQVGSTAISINRLLRAAATERKRQCCSIDRCCSCPVLISPASLHHTSIRPDPTTQTQPITQSQIRAAAERLLPPNAGEIANARGTTHISMTLPHKTGKELATHKVVSRFNGTADLVDALEASCYIPYYAGPKFTTT